MKLIFVALLLFVFNSNAQTVLEPPKNQIILPDIVLATPAALAQAETRYDARQAQHVDRLEELQARIETMRGRHEELRARIPEIKQNRDYYRKNDGCWNTLGRKTREYNCTAPFSGDTETLRENWRRAREADDLLDASKDERRRLAREIRAAEREARELEKERERLAKQEEREQERLEKERARVERAQAEALARSQRESVDELREAAAREEAERKAERAIEERRDIEQQRDMDELRAQIKRRDVQTAFAELRLQENEVEHAIHLIQEEYDRSLLGAYMHKKFENLLQSNVFCKKVSECQSGRKTPVTADDMAELFPSRNSPRASGEGSPAGSR